MAKIKNSIYTVNKRGRFFFFCKKKKPIQKEYFAYEHLNTLSNHSRRSALRYCKNIRGNYPGVYGIFVVEKGRNRLNLGKCLYVGQSVNIKRRKQEHEKCLAIAANEIKRGLKRTLNEKYYKIVKRIEKGEKIKFVTIFSIDKKEWSKLDLDEARELLCLYEQWAMDTYKPTTNVLSSRMTERRLFFGKEIK